MKWHQLKAIWRKSRRLCENKLGLNQLQQSHLQSKTDVKNAKKEIKELQELRHQMQIDIDQLNDDFYDKIDFIQIMENDIDVLDAKAEMTR